MPFNFFSNPLLSYSVCITLKTKVIHTLIFTYLWFAQIFCWFLISLHFGQRASFVIILILLNIFGFDLWPSTWSILENVPFALHNVWGGQTVVNRCQHVKEFILILLINYWFICTTIVNLLCPPLYILLLLLVWSIDAGWVLFGLHCCFHVTICFVHFLKLAYWHFLTITVELSIPSFASFCFMYFGAIIQYIYITCLSF